MQRHGCDLDVTFDLNPVTLILKILFMPYLCTCRKESVQVRHSPSTEGYLSRPVYCYLGSTAWFVTVTFDCGWGLGIS